MATSHSTKKEGNLLGSSSRCTDHVHQLGIFPKTGKPKLPKKIGCFPICFSRLFCFRAAFGHEGRLGSGTFEPQVTRNGVLAKLRKRDDQMVVNEQHLGGY